MSKGTPHYVTRFTAPVRRLGGSGLAHHGLVVVGLIALTLFMIAAVADYARPVRPATWRRYLALFLDSLPAGRAAPTTLPEPALSPAEMEQALRSGPARQRPAGE